MLAYIPSPAQGVWQLGPVPLRAYALCIIAGIIVALWWGERRWRDRGGRPGAILDVAMFAVPFGLVGGRLYHVATDWQKYFGADGHPMDALKVYQGGLGIWGAVLLGGVGAWIGCRVYRIPLPALGDALAPPILLAQAIGRIGNYFNQELYGRETDLPWGLEIYRRFDDNGKLDMLTGVSTGQVDKVVHPTFLYELLWNVLVVLALVWLDRRFRIGHGRLFALYVAGYSFGRFFVELMRDDEATKIAGIRINSFTSAVVFLLAIAYVIFATRGREAPEQLRPDGEDQDDVSAAADQDADSDGDGTAKTEEFPVLTKPGGGAPGPDADAETTEIDSVAVTEAVAQADADDADAAESTETESTETAATDVEAEAATQSTGAVAGEKTDSDATANSDKVGDSDKVADSEAESAKKSTETETAAAEPKKSTDDSSDAVAQASSSTSEADAESATGSKKQPVSAESTSSGTKVDSDS
ncbi:hypothetical protein GCM10023318_39710 [Nocardia callitridis]|uniref:Phosphatidylglycerol--prolipoprotein diacylglyceryl transferase n=1 Tax=Nocardia callitridis TaxID=648753 RepID=A0ABP9KLG6_9NOCA